MNAFDVLFDHHNTLRGLCKKITDTPPTSSERQVFLDELLVELDIHMRIEDDLFYPAVQGSEQVGCDRARRASAGVRPTRRGPANPDRGT